MTEHELIEQARTGDESAIHALYERHAPRVLAIAQRVTGNESAARDCAQETWIRALRALPTFRGEAQFGTWLHRIAVNCALGVRRAHLRLERRETVLPEQLSAGEPRGDVLLRLRLEEALALLPDRMRQVLVLHDVEGFTHEEIGEMLGIVPGTCKSQLFRARAKMRELLRPAANIVEDKENACSI